MRILHKYILREILGSFVLGVVLLAVVFGMGHLREYGDVMAASGLSVWDVIRMFMLVMPVVALYLVPVSFLVAILLTFGRMSRDGEVLAARACGLHLGTMTRPVLALSFVLTAVLFYCSDRGGPWAKSQVESLAEDLVMGASTDVLQPGEWVESANDLRFYVERVDDNGELHDVKIEYSSEDRPPVHVRAKSGRMEDVDGEKVVVLEGCEIVAFGQMANTNIERAEVRLTQALESLRESQKPISRRDDGTLRIGQLLAKARHPDTSAKRKRRAMEEAGERIALPFACVALALVGTSLGARALGGGRPYSLGVALPAVGAYYALMLVGQTVSDVSALSPLVTAWIPNVVVGGTGAAMTYRAANK